MRSLFMALFSKVAKASVHKNSKQQQQNNHKSTNYAKRLFITKSNDAGVISHKSQIVSNMSHTGIAQFSLMEKMLNIHHKNKKEKKKQLRHLYPISSLLSFKMNNSTKAIYFTCNLFKTVYFL